jgi:acyl-CoA thioester hydrolase
MTARPSRHLTGFPIVLEIPVAWGDMDALGHVNNTVFFRYFESARIAYLDAIGLIATESRAIGPILASTQCRFRRPLRFPDTVQVGARTTELLDDRFTMEYRIVSSTNDAVAADGSGVVVAYDYDGNCKAKLPDAVKKRIVELERRLRSGVLGE